MEVNTRITKLLDVRLPILCAPMAFASGSDLASAVTAAGGFGLMGAGFFSTDELKKHLSSARNRLGVQPGDVIPIGVGFIGWILDNTESSNDPRLEAVLAEKPKVIWLAFGVDLEKYVAQIQAYDAKRDHKTLIFLMVNSVEQALAAEEWKVDVIVAQGIEAGGHGGSLAPSLLTLAQAVIRALPNGPPIVTTGGISTGGQIAALLTLGAHGVVLGTRFLFTDECLYTPVMKDILVKSATGCTTRTLAFDEVGRTNFWPPFHDGRAISNRIMDDVAKGLDLETRLKEFDESKKAGSSDRLIIWAGEGVGLTDKITKASDVVSELEAEMKRSLATAAQLLRS